MRAEGAAQGPSVNVRVPAKVNLFLAVRGRRPDGYHELVTVLQTVSIYDRLSAVLEGAPGRRQHPSSRRRMRLELVHDGGAAVPNGKENLAVLAARAIGAAAGVTELLIGGVRTPATEAAARTVLHLSKGIPVAGGMAGGSADAAAALIALNELWDCELTRDQLRDVAASIGSDVPFCVVGGTALATGRGTALAQVLSRGTFHWVVCRDAEPLPTAAVYDAWDRRCQPSEIEPDAVLAALRSQDAEALGAALHNDLEPAAFALRPRLAKRARRLREAGALGVVLSGSGPTILGLAGSEDAARELATAVADECAEASVAWSPAGGPDLRRR